MSVTRLCSRYLFGNTLPVTHIVYTNLTSVHTTACVHVFCTSRSYVTTLTYRTLSKRGTFARGTCLARLLCDADPTEIVLLETQFRNKEEATTVIQWIFDNVINKLYPRHPGTGPQAYQCGIAYYRGLRNERRSSQTQT